jgi:hypothetical protein
LQARLLPCFNARTQYKYSESILKKKIPVYARRWRDIMPSAMYFYPFNDKSIDSGFVGNVSAKAALHCVAPTFGAKKFAYLWKMGAQSSTFAQYMGPRDRIYVLGHCGPGEDKLTTGIAGPDFERSATELAQLFHDHGLFKGSQTHIRIHGCNSGEESAPNASDSFAEEFKKAMVTIGYKDVTIRGYKSGMGYYFIWREGECPWNLASDVNNILQFDPPLA